MAADTIQPAISLVDGVRIESIITASRHATRDHTVGKRYQIDAEQLRSTLHLAFFGFPMSRLCGIARLEHIQQRVSKLRQGRVADKVPFTKRSGEMHLW